MQSSQDDNDNDQAAAAVVVVVPQAAATPQSQSPPQQIKGDNPTTTMIQTMDDSCPQSSFSSRDDENSFADKESSSSSVVSTGGPTADHEQQQPPATTTTTSCATDTKNHHPSKEVTTNRNNDHDTRTAATSKGGTAAAAVQPQQQQPAGLLEKVHAAASANTAAIQSSLATTRSSLSLSSPAAATTTTTTASSAAPIRLQVKPSPLANRKSRKRKATHNPLAAAATTTTTATTTGTSGYTSSGSSENSSGGSSDEDEQQQQQPSHSFSPYNVHLHQINHKMKRTGLVMDPMNISQHYEQNHQHRSATMGDGNNNNNNNNSTSTTTSTTTGNTTTTTANNNRADTTSSSTNRSLEQPKGWRVKLYRLNTDGSWDDCGTGRIQCLYKQQTNHVQPPPPPPNDDDDNNNNNDDGDKSNTTPPDHWLYQKTGEPTLCVQAELTKQNRHPRVLLRTRILLRDAYQRQGDNIITWCEPGYTPPPQQQQQQQQPAQDGTTPQEQDQPQQHEGEEDDEERAEGNGGVDLALSFQDNAGCLDIWRQITHVQSQAAELSSSRDSSVQRLAAAVAAQHHADLIQQDQHHHQHQHHHHHHYPQSQQGGPPNPQQHPQSQQQQTGGPHHLHHHYHHNAYRPGQLQQGSSTEQLWVHMTEDDHHRVANDGYHLLEATTAPPSLPDPPTLQNLEEIADAIAALQHAQQRESLAMWIAKDECRYLKALLALFPTAEQNGDFEKLATLAACVKTILLLNDPSIVELIVTIADLFEKVCACLEYDPDLREKANHRWFLRERAKFRTVVPMEDPELVAAIHRCFRVTYLRDTLLRPTMDESSLSALSSMQTFSHGDVVRGVTVSPDKDASLAESYLIRLVRVFGNELHALSVLEWMELDAHADSQIIPDYETDDTRPDPSIVVGKASLDGATWKQYLAPQDPSMRSRRMRRRGCLSFLRELFSMVRNSLQQSDKDDFFAVVCGFEIELGDDISDNVSQNSQLVEVGSLASTVKSDRLGTDVSSQPEFPPPSSPVTLLSLLGNVLSDPNTDATERGFVLEIIGTVAIHDPALIRRHCLAHYNGKKKCGFEEVFVGRPDPNEQKQVVFQCARDDLLAALIFLLASAVDAGVLLQVSEIMRLLLDTDMMGDQGPPNAGFADEAEGVAPHALHGADHPNPPSATGSGLHQNGTITTTDQKQFLSMFYQTYVEWLVAPFLFQVFQCVRRIPTYVLRSPQESALMEKMISTFRKGIPPDDPFLRPVPSCAIRSSFAVELLSFCVRAHLYRMKFFLLRSRVLGSVLELLRRPTDRCLKLAALRFLRAILSVNDEFYHRHIIQHDLFAPVFAAFRANPVGDNLVSSAIVEMCDYIHTEGIKSLLEYVVTKHLSATPTHETIPSLEDVSSPYVSTLTVLRKAYESLQQQQQREEEQQQSQNLRQPQTTSNAQAASDSSYFVVNSDSLSGSALEDQRKFQQADAEESYFESGGKSSDDLLHRTPRMLSFPTQTDSDPASNAGFATGLPTTTRANQDIMPDPTEDAVKN